MRIIYFDFEYRDNEKAGQLVLLTYQAEGAAKAVDLRSAAGREEVRNLTRKYSDWIWAAFNAEADLKCLMTLGVDIRELSVIDLMAEANMICLTHPRYTIGDGVVLGLLAYMTKFGVATGTDSESKADTVQTILANETYTDQQWSKIVKYGLEDTAMLPRFYAAMCKVIFQKNNRIGETHEAMRFLVEQVDRGEYVKAATHLYFHSKGFPVDVVFVNAVYGYRSKIRAVIIDPVNEAFPGVYTPNGPGEFKLNGAVLTSVIQKMGLEETWPKTATGGLSFAGIALEKASENHPELAIVYKAKRALDQLKGVDYRTLLTNDDSVRAGYKTFSQRTSRTSPLWKKGFVLNLVPWLRLMIKPKPGEVVIGLDWSQQEIAIAAAVSGDTQLQAAYDSGDVYLALGKMAGTIPKDGTKQTHKTQRNDMKAVQLGMAYGKGKVALGLTLYNNYIDKSTGLPTKTLEEANQIAVNLYQWHKRHFKAYWAWNRNTQQEAIMRGFWKSRDGWYYFCDVNTKGTKLQNLPMQATGAAIMREMIKKLSKLNVDVICSLHDAVYVRCSEEVAEETAGVVQRVMADAVAEVLGEGSMIRVDAKVFDSEKGYQADEDTWYKAKKMYEMIMALLDTVKACDYEKVVNVSSRETALLYFREKELKQTLAMEKAARDLERERKKLERAAKAEAKGGDKAKQKAREDLILQF